MLQVRVTAPTAEADAAVEGLRDDPTVVNLVVLRGVLEAYDGDLLLFDVARENANAVLSQLRRLGIEERGSITIDDTGTVLSRAADRAERAAPGNPADGVVWSSFEADSRANAAMSWSFLVFLTLATLIAGVGRYLDQPILIIGAMVVGPEFAPVAAICFALARRRFGLVPPAALTLFGGFLVAGTVAWVAWAVAELAGIVDHRTATTGSLTQFIIQPDAWSLVIALLAGSAGVLSLTTSKSSALVGVFISITTVPAVGTIALTLAVGAWSEAGQSLVQLAVNIAGLIVSGTLTLVVEGLLWRRSRSVGAARRLKR